jgi:hypothetical protein
VQAEIAASAATVDELFARMEDAGQLLRLDPAVTPRMFHGAIVSVGELELLRTITDVVRLGRVQRIEAGRIVLDEGSVDSSPGRLYIDCSAIGAPRRPTKPIFEAGHVPMIGEWVALPVLSSAGADGPTDPLAADVMYPTAERLLHHCDAVLRLPGASRGADRDVAIAQERGIPVYHSLAEIPRAS